MSYSWGETAATCHPDGDRVGPSGNTDTGWGGGFTEVAGSGLADSGSVTTGLEGLADVVALLPPPGEAVSEVSGDPGAAAPTGAVTRFPAEIEIPGKPRGGPEIIEAGSGRLSDVVFELSTPWNPVRMMSETPGTTACPGVEGRIRVEIESA